MRRKGAVATALGRRNPVSTHHELVVRPLHADTRALPGVFGAKTLVLNQKGVGVVVVAAAALLHQRRPRQCGVGGRGAPCSLQYDLDFARNVNQRPRAVSCSCMLTFFAAGPSPTTAHVSPPLFRLVVSGLMTIIKDDTAVCWQRPVVVSAETSRRGALKTLGGSGVRRLAAAASVAAAATTINALPVAAWVQRSQLSRRRRPGHGSVSCWRHHTSRRPRSCRCPPTGSLLQATLRSFRRPRRDDLIRVSGRA